MMPKIPRGIFGIVYYSFMEYLQLEKDLGLQQDRFYIFDTVSEFKWFIQDNIISVATNKHKQFGVL